jgi:hypothetical protein
MMVGPIVLGAVAVIHGVLFRSDFHGYASLLTRFENWQRRSRRWGYSLGEGRYRRQEYRWQAAAIPAVRRFGGGFAIVVGVVAIIAGFFGHPHH